MAKRDEEKAKLSAQFLDRLAAWVVTFGALATPMGYLFGTSHAMEMNPFVVLAVAGISLVLGVMLHLLALNLLDKLE